MKYFFKYFNEIVVIQKVSEITYITYTYISYYKILK